MKNQTDHETLLAIGGLSRVVGIKDFANAPRPVLQIEALFVLGVRYFFGWEQHLGTLAPSDSWTRGQRFQPPLPQMAMCKRREKKCCCYYEQRRDDW
ncbi:hypothetical protein [Methylobacterium tarhaniae]|uniref:hypothetical protein n=1 Tax=Methylobacterium tarhaniae TaxID=1187852 RepID=UPI000AB4751A|nr:hypothetical protein [Methylobacterium tarhaniae]